ncbi:MAG TPA: CocE/NonD family hydrolase [Thermoanaerobaculia bacterium]|nr:CocE/NonD family hydrolase [Thermoanaerobaculia bacterium]
MGAGAAFAFLLALAAPVEPPGSAYDLAFGVAIPMRDGVHLNATLYLPRERSGGRPVLFRMTPYGSDWFHPEASYFARRGFAFAAVDVRGRGGSGGRFEPWVNDGRDGHDLVEWLARQSWSNGKVGMLGESYSGRAVWSTLKENPPHLAAAVPISASYPMWGWKNIEGPDAMQWILLTAGKTHNTRLAADSDFWLEKYRDLWISGRPLADFDRIVGTPSEVFQRFLDHPTLDSFWTGPTPTPADFARISIPLLTITASNEANAGPLWYYHEHLRAAGAVARHRLLIGPWDHHGTLRPRSEVGGLTFAPAAVIDMKALLADWFEHALSGGPLPAFLEPPVRYYVAGAEEWRGAATLAEVAGARTRLYLASEGVAGSLSRPGRLDPEPGRGAPADGWVHDPRDLRPGLAETEEIAEWLTRFESPDDLWGKGAAYLSAPLPAAELLGDAQASIWLALDVPDADFSARLDLLTPEGQTILIDEDWGRARYRRSLERPELISPGVPFELSFTFGWEARALAPGSRLRLILRSPSSVFMGRNFQGGGEVARESVHDARTARVRVLHDREHPSYLEVGLSLPAAPSPQ